MPPLREYVIPAKAGIQEGFSGNVGEPFHGLPREGAEALPYEKQTLGGN